MPNVVTFADGSTITYTYAADGTKLRTVHNINGTTTQKDYCGSAIYENGIAKFWQTEAGYISMDDSKYHYYLQDHQGNNRVVVSETGASEEINHYYAFGGLFGNSNNVQPFKYNGKELDTKKGLNWYDYGARQYDAALSRWLAIDPLAEKDYLNSPYSYCGNNPIIRIDQDGQIWDIIWDVVNVLYDIGAAVVNHISGDHDKAKDHWIDAGTDVAAMLIPGIPAGMTKLEYADDVVDLVKTTNVEDVAKSQIKDFKINIEPENKIDRNLLNKSSRLDGDPTFKSDGGKVEIHHEGQNPNGPFKEMHWEEHRGKNNYKKNHPDVTSYSRVDRKIFNKVRKEYWRKENEKW